MKIVYKVGIIFFVCWLSQWAEKVIPLPATIIGMLLLFLLLLAGVLRIHHIREKSDFLLANMAFFFIPAGVSIVNYLDLLRSAALQLVVVCLVTTVITFAATAWSIRLTLRLMNRRAKG